MSAPHRSRVPLLALAVLAASPPAARAQVRAGGEFRVNTYTGGYQYVRASAAAAAADGRFVVVWESGSQDGSGYAAVAARFDAAGARLGAEFIVNAYTTGDQYFCAIGMNDRGRFVVAWQSYGQDGSQAGVFAQRYESGGARAGGEFRVNAYTSETQSRASVALDAGAGFVAAWRSSSPVAPQDGDASGVFAQRFGFAGAPLGGEFQVNAYTTQYQNRPDVARASDGTFVVAWQSYDQEGAGSGYGVFARRYAANGSGLGGEFRVNTYTTGDQARPSVAADAAGAFVVAWTEYAPRDGSFSSIRAQRYTAGGAPAGSEFQVNTYTTGAQYWPQVGVAADGGAFVVAWTDPARDGSGAGVFARRFNGAGGGVGAEFIVNSYTTGHQYSPNVAVDAAGNFVIAWNSAGQDGSATGVYAQRHGGLVPAALAVDTVAGSGQDGNRVFEPGEDVDVRPSWRNVSGAAQALAGALAGVTGPPGATYAITDAAGDYGTVGNLAVGACADCYRVSVDDPAARPAQHWDAAVLETLSPAGQGQQKRWRLHVGRSFADVPPASGFYRFIETLLHHSVTGGCTATSYCPSANTTREQMAVFVLVAREGAGYAPPACGTPMFADVPAASPFCPFIEELARRGVVTGCGGGNYCPAATVTREQMAIFTLVTLDPALNPPPCGTPMFLDVPAASPFCRWIEELARRGVVTGCGGGNYCPLSPVTREQMGVFISVTFGLALYGP